MQIELGWRKALAAGIALMALGAGAVLAANKFGKPKSVVHVVALYYKDGTTDEQKQAVLDGIEKMASEIPGIKNVWLKSTKMQGSYMEKLPDGSYKAHPFTDAFVMEFENEAAFKAYDDHPAHRAWEKVYTAVRGRSSTIDITNN
jgi:hypothetical protein